MAFVAVLVGVYVYIKKKAKKPPASAEEGQKQVGVTLTGPVEHPNGNLESVDAARPRGDESPQGLKKEWLGAQV